MVKLVDTRDLKSLGDLAVPVQVRLGPPNSTFPSLRKSTKVNENHSKKSRVYKGSELCDYFTHYENQRKLTKIM